MSLIREMNTVDFEGKSQNFLKIKKFQKNNFFDLFYIYILFKMNDDLMICSSRKRKSDAVESFINTSDQTESFNDEIKICGICQDDLKEKDASKGCKESDKHDFHKECLER